MNTIIVESNGRKQWSTDTWNNPKWWTYIKPEYKYDRNYHNWYSLTDFIQKIKNEIDNWRPIIIWYTSKDKKSWHSIVWQWYRWNRIYTNFWWWAWSSNVSLDLTWRNFKWFEREWTFDRLDYIYNIRK